MIDLYTLAKFKECTMKKQTMAALIALLMTVCVGASIFVIGGTALLNQKGGAVSNSASQTSGQLVKTSAQPSQLDQLQSLVSQYQDREQQYQQREQQLQQQLAQANTQIQQDQQMVQQVQMLLGALQQRGLIQITNDGRILITR
jgi:peptidoglycan hydrolase CwlO-like protein